MSNPSFTFLIGSLIITEHGNNTAGENYSLTCNARVSSEPNLIWKGPGGNITEQSPSIILQEIIKLSDSHYAGTIVFAPLQVLHEGKYTCEIQSLDSSSRPFQVTVKSKLIVSVRFLLV